MRLPLKGIASRAQPSINYWRFRVDLRIPRIGAIGPAHSRFYLVEKQAFDLEFSSLKRSMNSRNSDNFLKDLPGSNMDFPYDSTLKKQDIASMYERMIGAIISVHPEASFASVHVNFDEDNVSTPYFYVSNLYDQDVEEIGTKDYDGSSYSPGVHGLADGGPTKAIYALSIPDEHIKQWDGWPIAFNLKERRTLTVEEREQLIGY